jgi:hypothetical protein
MVQRRDLDPRDLKRDDDQGDPDALESGPTND